MFEMKSVEPSCNTLGIIFCSTDLEKDVALADPCWDSKLNLLSYYWCVDGDDNISDCHDDNSVDGGELVQDHFF